MKDIKKCKEHTTTKNIRITTIDVDLPLNNSNHCMQTLTLHSCGLCGEITRMFEDDEKRVYWGEKVDEKKRKKR